LEEIFMKNFGLIKIFVIGVIFASMMIFSANCSAVDYYVGIYKGAEKYLMTETAKVLSKKCLKKFLPSVE